MKHVALISGKDSLATAIVQKQLQPDLEYEYIFNDTGAELPEVYAWLDKVEVYLSQKITRVGENLQDIIEDEGILPGPRTRYCTRKAKIYPLEDYLSGNELVTVYYGLRADEPERIGYQANSKSNIIPAYPLRDLGLGLQDVWQMLDQLDLLPPQFIWQEMIELVKKQLGSNSYLIDNLPKFVFNRLFAGRTRPNCFYCFFQRLYEWVWLSKTHPDLFAIAVEMEQTIGAKNYKWRSDYSLPEIANQAERIMLDRAKEIIKKVMEYSQLNMFEDTSTTGLDLVSCGLMCGK